LFVGLSQRDSPPRPTVPGRGWHADRTMVLEKEKPFLMACILKTIELQPAHPMSVATTPAMPGFHT
jgi:hypothetical protein